MRRALRASAVPANENAPNRPIADKLGPMERAEEAMTRSVLSSVAVGAIIAALSTSAMGQTVRKEKDFSSPQLHPGTTGSKATGKKRIKSQAPGASGAAEGKSINSKIPGRPK